MQTDFPGTHFCDQDRQAILDHIRQMDGRRIVAIDGADGAGKTTFANEIAPLIRAEGKTVISASIDGFHNPRSLRYTRGKDDPHGFFLDSYNYSEFWEYLVSPFRKGAETVHLARFDHRADQESAMIASVPKDAVLLVDGIFLHRDELYHLWDFSVFLNVPFSETFRRMSVRDGCDPDPFASSNRRYHQGQQIYFESCRPLERASIVLCFKSAC